MSEIHILDSRTIDKIAAGEVVERPASVIKELVENAIDAHSTHITVEIKDGGTTLMRVTDDGCGIDKSEINKAFMRHATSKIEDASDLALVKSLGFRGEALSSISAVCQVELITKTENDLTGIRISCNGGAMSEPEEIGAPTGTTVIVRNIFYNTPVRRKFLKTPQTEGGYISELISHIALSCPSISFQLIMNGQTKLYTSGNGKVTDIIYRMYGRDVKDNLMEIETKMQGVTLHGYLGKPILSRANRVYETFFVNNRYIKSSLISAAVEEGYKTFLMQHKYPFVVLYFTVDPSLIDVNVHPTKMEIRINDPGKFLEFISQSVKETLTGKNLIYSVEEKPFELSQEDKAKQNNLYKSVPQPFEKNRIHEKISNYRSEKETRNPKGDSLVEKALKGELNLGNNPDMSKKNQDNSSALGNKTTDDSNLEHDIVSTHLTSEKTNSIKYNEKSSSNQNAGKEESSDNNQSEMPIVNKGVQMELFSENEMRQALGYSFTIVGQVFDTYWIVEADGKLYYIDQHAAHEKVMYEKLMKQYNENAIHSQQLCPPVALTLSVKEKNILLSNLEYFEKLGFEIDDFGDQTYALRAVPMDLYSQNEKEMFLNILDEMLVSQTPATSNAILSKIASMSCKAAVKGNMKLSIKEAKALIEELFKCENPFNCPHGRPTAISMTRYELEKKFKR